MNERSTCSKTGCGCGGVQRRDFLKCLGASATVSLVPGWPVMAGPFTRQDFAKLVPADKKLSADWVKSLFARGAPTVYRGAELEKIGMPVGGICAGQLYLGGDGKLWHWDIFNHYVRTSAEHYAKPMKPTAPLTQGFTLTIGGKMRALDSTGFSDIRFRGEYPIGHVEYRAEGVAVTLEAFAPFIPLNTDDSSLPATVMQFAVKNTSNAAVEATLNGSLENVIARSAVCVRRNRTIAGPNFTFLECSAQKSTAPEAPPQPDIVFEDWNRESYDGWKVEGTAFGAGPIRKSAIPSYQGDVGGDTERVVNSHATAPGTNVAEKDNATGKLTSRPFRIERNYITFWIGGGGHPGKTCLNLLVGGPSWAGSDAAGQVVRSATGKGDNKMTLQSFDVRALKGKEAAIEIVDAQQGSWGNIGVGKITFTDRGATPGPLEQLPDFGTMGLALLGDPATVTAVCDRRTSVSNTTDGVSPASLPDSVVGELGRTLRLGAGESVTATFVLTWHFPNLTMAKLPGGRFYAVKFDSAAAVAKYVADHFERLASQTRLWHDTWYDSTLPYWFLDRTFLNTSILATSTCFRFMDGRFYGWEGVGCCAGTCGHVWHYAHAVGRLFPELERDLRERVDFGLAMKPDGAIRFRGEHNDMPAVDGQAGAVLRALREHQMSVDDAFLKRNWPGIKKATEWLIAQDADNDGIIAGSQHNTLDANWFGPVAWLSGLYLAALRAAEELAREVGDAAFAQRCRTIWETGRQRILDLFDGAYFINQPDPKHPNAINSGTGCEVDQVFGQSWAWQVGLGRVLPEKETLSALGSLWKYNFSPDVGPYREVNKPGRWYAMAGEAGLLMCTFPRTDWDFQKACGVGNTKPGPAGYFNECMNGFEYQAAGHMIWEGLVQEGLAVTRAVHDRYHASRRNPWNEVECGDHYARSMASYGVYLAACGFEYHGPKGHIGFAPRLTPENFKAAFTTAEGWGTFSQKTEGRRRKAEITVKYGRLRVKTVSLVGQKVANVSMNGQPVEFRHEAKDGKVLVILATEVVVLASHKLEVTSET